MNDPNIDNEDEQQQAQAEREQQEGADARRRRRLRLISVLEGFDGIPFQTRNKTDELVEHFLEHLGDDVHDMLCDNDINSDNYRGLDCEQDTDEEVEAIVRFFPEVLTRTKDFEGVGNLYPIQLLSLSCARNEDDIIWGCNVNAVSFVPLVARLAMELGLFEEEERGGLLCNGENVLNDFMLSDQSNINNREHHEPIDDKYLQVLIRLRNMGFFKKEDIQRYGLLHILCSRTHYFAERRFRFLVEWDPNALIHPNIYGNLPIHFASHSSSVQGFRMVFEYGIRYYPNKKGIHLLFRKKNNGVTPFQLACEKFGYEQVMEVVEETLIRSSSSDDTPINITQALLSAAIDEKVHLDCVHFLLRRQPDVLVKLLSSTPVAAAAATESNNNNDGNEGGDGNSNVSVTRTLNSKKNGRDNYSCATVYD
jgi:hypothetical protein